MSNRSVIKLVIGLAATALALVTVQVFGRKKTRNPLAFGTTAMVTATNARYLSIGITNLGNRGFSYLPAPAQKLFNGVWPSVNVPMGRRMTHLNSGESGIIVVDTSSIGEDLRVPVLWSFDYSIKTSRWSQVLSETWDTVTGRNPGGYGRMFTNYLENVTY